METINIKGKEYVMVNERVKEFRSNELYKWYSLETIIIECTDKRVVMQALVKDKDWRVIAMWTAFEEKDSPNSMVNKTSYIENCETSAVGRALGYLWIWIGTSIASAEEVTNAIKKQETTKQPAKQTKYKSEISWVELSEKVYKFSKEKLWYAMSMEEQETFKKLKSENKDTPAQDIIDSMKVLYEESIK